MPTMDELIEMRTKLEASRCYYRALGCVNTTDFTPSEKVEADIAYRQAEAKTVDLRMAYDLLLDRYMAQEAQNDVPACDRNSAEEDAAMDLLQPPVDLEA